MAWEPDVDSMKSAFPTDQSEGVLTSCLRWATLEFPLVFGSHVRSCSWPLPSGRRFKVLGPVSSLRQWFWKTRR